MLKRMGKADFCCREHEIRYYDEGQRLMLQQLIALRERLDALGRNDEAKHYPLTA